LVSDLHRKRSQIAALDEQGTELLSRRVANDPNALKTILAELDGELKVALEATYGWEWLADLLDQEGHELHLSHPLRTKAIAAARVKTDAVDARTLAHLLRTDLLPEAYVAPRELRGLRDLLRHRVVLTRMRSALKTPVHALLSRQGIQREHADLFGTGGRRFLADLELREPARRRLESLLSLISDFDREIELAKREIDALARHDPRVDVLCQLRDRSLHGHVGDRRGRRDRALPLSPPPLRLGLPHSDRPLLRRPRSARPHLAAGPPHIR
jgi:transposase